MNYFALAVLLLIPLTAQSADAAVFHLKAFDLPPQNEKLVITTAGIVRLGEVLAQSYLEQENHRQKDVR